VVCVCEREMRGSPHVSYTVPFCMYDNETRQSMRQCATKTATAQLGNWEGALHKSQIEQLT